ncbi:MAG: minor capsid protein [Clostridium sp.]|nr:minor capsid protein [Clostridium sp.]
MTKEELFIESLYEEANKDLKEVYKQKKESRDELLKEIAMVMLTYTIIDGIMDIKKSDKDKAYEKLSKLIIIGYKTISKKEVNVLNNILESTVKKTFNFYSYNADLKDVRKIIENNFKGKHFSERVWSNEQEVAKHLHKQVDKFLDGKINVNQIKKDIEKTFNASAYNAKRLVETEVNRCEDEAFRRFCKETGVTKVKRNEVLDSKTCEECAKLNGVIFDLDDAPGVVHPCCRGFNEIYE